MKETEEIKQLKNKAKLIDNLITKGVIKNQEIEELLHLSINEMLSVKLKLKDTNKKKCMYYIYFNPYILYFSSNISENVKEELPQFIEYRYKLELYEFDNKFKNGELNETEYNEEIEKLQMSYFYTSPIGKNIGRLMEVNEKNKVKKIEN